LSAFNLDRLPPGAFTHDAFSQSPTLEHTSSLFESHLNTKRCNDEFLTGRLTISASNTTTYIVAAHGTIHGI
jgi:hypothetical protein